MSPSVYSSTRLLLTTKNSDLRMFNKPEVRKVKRNLFGPVDQKATSKFIEDELKKIMISKSEKWNFDFTTESNLQSDGMFEWTPATPRKQSTTPGKRKFVDDEESSNQYFKLKVLPEADLLRSRPVEKCSTSSSEHRAVQRRITDFMKATKRPLANNNNNVTKKIDFADIPTKMPRLDIVS